MVILVSLVLQVLVVLVVLIILMLVLVLLGDIPKYWGLGIFQLVLGLMCADIFQNIGA